MKIEKLDTDKIRIILNLEDLKNNSIDFHSFMANSKESQNLFLYILDLAAEQVGFITDNYKVSIETMYLNNGCFILNVTRFKGEKTFKNPRVKPKIKEFSNKLNSSIYTFSNIDIFLDFYNKLKSTININIFRACKYSIYFSNDKYYLILNIDCLNIKYQNLIINILSEFFDTLTYNISIENNLIEHGKCICKDKILT